MRNETEVATPLIAGQLAWWDRYPRRQQAGYQEVRFLRNETEMATPLIAGQLARWDRYPKRQQAGHA